MTEIFISYSRRDKVFVEKFLKALNENGYAPEDIWVDWEDIPASSKWEDQIRKGVEASNSIIFVISPEWLRSKECTKELEVAAEYKKRLFPIIWQEVDSKAIQKELASLNWIFFRETDNFDEALQKLLSALKTDLGWVEQHTNLLRQANEWQAKGHDAGYLLRGSELQEAETWLSQATEDREPHPTQLQSEYIFASRQDDVRRQRRNLIWVSTGLIVSILLAIAALVSGISAVRQSQRALASHLAAQSTNLVNSQPDLSLLLSLEANYIGDEMGESDPALIGSLVTTLNSSRKLDTFLRAHKSDVRAVAFSSDGHWLVTAGNPSSDVNQVMLWDMTSDQQPRPYQEFTGGTQRFLAVAFSPDNKVFAAAGDDKKLFVWDPVKCCAPLHEWPVNGEARALAFAMMKGRDYVAIASSSQVTFWDYTTGTMDGELTLELPAPVSGVEILSLTVSPVKNLLAVGDRAGNVTVWDLATRQTKMQRCSYGEINTDTEGYCQLSEGDTAEIRGVAFNTQGTLLLSGSSDQRAWLWDVTTGQLLARSAESGEGGHINAVTGVAFNPQDDHKIASVSWDNTVRLWDVVEGETWSLKRVDTLAGHSSSIWSAAYSPDGKILATPSSDKTVILWKVNQINQIGTPVAPQLEGQVWALAATSDGNKFAAGDEAGNIRIWEFKDGQWTNSITLTHPDGVLALAVSRNNKWLASAGYGDTIRVWDLESGQEVWKIEKAHDDEIWALMFSPDDTKLASASYDKTVKLWDTATHQQVGKSLEHAVSMYALTFNNDGTQLLAAGYDRNIYQWDVINPASSPTPKLLTGHTAVVNSVAFNPIYPSLFASTSDDKTLVIWNMNANEHTEPVLGLSESMEAVTFSPNGQWLASATNNNTVLLWELDSERCSKAWDKATCQPNRLGTPLAGHTAQVQNVVFLSDTLLVSSSGNGQLILWNLDKSFWYKHACDIVNRPFSPSEYRQYIEHRINLGLLNIFSWFANVFGAKPPPVEAPTCISR